MMALWACVPPQSLAAGLPPSIAAPPLSIAENHPLKVTTRNKQPYPVASSSLREKEQPLPREVGTSWSQREFHAFARKSSVANWRRSRPTGSSLRTMMIRFDRLSPRSRAARSLRKCTYSSATVSKSLKEATMGIKGVRWCLSLWLSQSAWTQTWAQYYLATTFELRSIHWLLC